MRWIPGNTSARSSDSYLSAFSCVVQPCQILLIIFTSSQPSLQDVCRSVARTLYCLAGEILGAQVLGRERAYVRSQHPDLIVGDPAAPRRHSIRPPLIDRFEHFACRSAKVPATILERWCH